MPRPTELHILRSRNGSGRVTAANPPVEAVILAAEVLEEGGHSIILVAWAGKVRRETTPEMPAATFGVPVRRTADASDPGTCELEAMW